MSFDLATLNDNQRVAVEWAEGPLLVLAGPGSGKTRVLTMRVANLVVNSPEKRFRILGLTFTNKAAAEMRNRVEQMVPDCRERVLLTTFHSFCADVLRQHGSHIGLSPDYVILNQDADREAVLADAVAALGRSEVGGDDRSLKMLPIIDRLLAECVEEAQVAGRFRDLELGERVAAVYREYINQLVSNNRLDFPALLTLTIRLFAQKPAIAKQLRTIYTHVCVDEFQDTNLAQYRILQAILGDSPRNLFVVADDDQIIYQWNGASPERLRSLRDDYKMQTIQLPANYRCPPEVIHLANLLIQNNLERSADKQPLLAVRAPCGQSVLCLHRASTLDEELDWVASHIASNHAENTGSCVILARTRKVLEAAVQHLEAAGVKAAMVMRKTEFTSAPLRWLHSLLRLANARGDREQLRRLCKAFYELEGLDLDVQQVVSDAGRLNGDYLRAWFEAAKTHDAVSPDTASFLTTGMRLIVERLDFLGFIDLALAWLARQERDLGGQDSEGFADFSDEKVTWQELQASTLDKYGRDELTLSSMLHEFDLSEKSPPAQPDAVRCLTIHTAKGMEFHHVYLVGLVEDQLPSFQSIKKGDQSREMQEERRNCFVAITRTQESLTLTYADYYNGWRKEPSRFLKEMGLLV